MKTKILNITLTRIVFATMILGVFVSCSGDEVVDTDDDSATVVVDVDTANFTTDGLTITIVPCELSDGTVTDCYQIVTGSVPTDHDMGPWCPTNIEDDASAGGIWLSDGEVFDVDGAFVENLEEFYQDATWQMYDDNGDIFITETMEDCVNAANPDVGEEYENFCVECLPSYITDLTQTWTIPITPVLLDEAVTFQTEGGGGGPGGQDTDEIPSTRGLALNGMEFSAPAPVDVILAAYTLAPFDDAGGHINVNQGYHYHAATGFSTEVAQDDDHAPLVGYALDGHGMYSYEEGNVPDDLDESRGHSDDVRGYHYHLDAPGNNNFINGLKGAYVVE